jgi:hypothetical protein
MSFASIASQPVFGAAGDSISFRMVPSAGAASCLAYSLPSGQVTVNDLGPVQNMHVEVFNLPGKGGVRPFCYPGAEKPLALSNPS